jgi:hypothetical protein
MTKKISIAELNSKLLEKRLKILTKPLMSGWGKGLVKPS